MQLIRPIQTRFPYGSGAQHLNLAAQRNSPARSTKSTTSRSYGALSACKLTVSGSISLPSRGSFHLSLTVLYSIGHQVVFSLRRWASLLPTEFLVLDGTLDLHSSILPISPTGLLPCLASFPLIFGYLCMSFFVKSEPRTYFYMRFRLLPFRSPLLR